MSITRISVLTITGPCTWAKATFVNKNTDPECLWFSCFIYADLWLFDVKSIVDTFLYSYILFVVYLYKGCCYNILLFQEMLLEYWDCSHWKQWIIWVLHVWIPSPSIVQIQLEDICGFFKLHLILHLKSSNAKHPQKKQLEENNKIEPSRNLSPQRALQTHRTEQQKQAKQLAVAERFL